MSYRENYDAINESQNNIVARYKSQLNNANRIHCNEMNEIFEAREERLAEQNAYANYIDSLKETLLFEALFNVYSKSVDESCLNRNKNMMKNNLMSYIKENGAESLLSRMRTKTTFLSEMALVIEEALDDIKDDADPDNPESLEPDKEKLNDFMDRLNNLQNAEDVENAIRMRVADAEEEFITDNMNDKYNANTIMNQTAQRIAALKKDTYGDEDSEEASYNADMEAEKTEEMNQEMTRLIMDRDKTLFEQMVTIVAESVMKPDNGVLHETFTTNGSLDVDPLVESVKCLYALMETLNTIKLEKYNADIVHEFLLEFK